MPLAHSTRSVLFGKSRLSRRIPEIQRKCACELAGLTALFEWAHSRWAPVVHLNDTLLLSLVHFLREQGSSADQERTRRKGEEKGAHSYVAT